MLVNMRFLNPLDTELLKEIAETCAHIVTVEDNLRKGGFGSKVLEYYGDAGIQTDVLNLAFPDKYIEQGTQAQLFERYGLMRRAFITASRKDWRMTMAERLKRKD